MVLWCWATRFRLLRPALLRAGLPLFKITPSDDLTSRVVRSAQQGPLSKPAGPSRLPPVPLLPAALVRRENGRRQGAGARLRWRPGRRPCPRDFLITATNGSVTLRVQVRGLSAGCCGEFEGLAASPLKPLTGENTCINRSSQWPAPRGLALLPRSLRHQQVQTASAAPSARVFSAASPQALLLAAPSRIVRLAIIRRRRPPTTDRRRRLMPMEEDSAGNCAKHAFTRKN